MCKGQSSRIRGRGALVAGRHTLVAGLVVAFVGVVAAGRVAAYRFFGDDLAPTSETAVRWRAEAWGPGERLAWDIADDPDWEAFFGSAEEARPFVERSLRPWSRLRTADISWGLDGFRAPAEVAEDGTNAIFIDEEASGPLGYARIWSKRAGPEGPWEIYECDVALGARFAEIPESIAEEGQAEFRQSERDEAVRTLVHEFGHCLGLAHSGALSLTPGVSSVHPGDPAMSYGFELDPPETLSRDDIVGASLLRPASGFGRRTGSLSGTLSMPEAPVEYAVVWALPVGTRPLRDRIGVFSGSEGEFVIEGLDPGEYVLMAQPAVIGAAHGGSEFFSGRMDDVVYGGAARVTAGSDSGGIALTMRWGREVRAPYGGATEERPPTGKPATPIPAAGVNVCSGVRVRAARPQAWEPPGGESLTWRGEELGDWFATTITVESPRSASVFFDWTAPYRDWFRRRSRGVGARKGWLGAAERDMISESLRIERSGSVVRQVMDVAWPEAAAPTLRFRSEDATCAREPLVVCDFAGCASLEGELAFANEAPRAAGSIADQTVTAGKPRTFSVLDSFSDPDGDWLSHEASSSRSSVVRANAAGSSVTLTPVSAGSATITVTATDPGGLQTTQTFRATVVENTCAVDDLGTLTGRVTRRGTLGPDCVGSFGAEDPSPARYYRFTLRQAGEVQIDLTSSAFDALLVLRQGTDFTGPQVAFDDDGGDGLNARITSRLAAGTYTIEATSYGGEGAFRLTVELGSGGGSADTFRAGDRIPNFPTGTPTRVSGASFVMSGGSVVITMQRGGVVEYPDWTFTCEANRCGIDNGLVTEGVVVRSPGAPPPSGNNIEFLDEDCDLTGPDGTLIVHCEGSVRALVALQNVGVRVELTGLDGDRRVVETDRDQLGDLRADEVRRWTVSGTFATTATRFRIRLMASYRSRGLATRSEMKQGAVTKTPVHW